MEYVQSASRKSHPKLDGTTIIFRNEYMADQTNMKTEFYSIHPVTNEFMPVNLPVGKPRPRTRALSKA